MFILFEISKKQMLTPFMYIPLLSKHWQVELLKTMDRRQANHLFWSPAGKFVILAGLRQMNGVLEFIDTSGNRAYYAACYTVCSYSIVAVGLSFLPLCFYAVYTATVVNMRCLD